MAVTPNRINNSYCRVSASGDGADGLQPRITARCQMRLGSTTAPALNESTSNAMFLVPGATVNFAFTVTGHTAGALGDPANTGTFGLWLYLFQDAVDGGGNGTSNVVSQQVLAVANRSFPSENAGGQFQSITSGTGSFTLPNSSGTYRAVLVIHSNGVGANPAQNQVDANGEFYWDSDRNGTFQDGGIGQPQAHFDAIAGTDVTSGWCRAVSTRTTSFTGSAQKQAGDLFTVSSAGTPGAAHSVKNVRIGLALPASAATVALIDESSLAMSTGAAVGPTANINVDTTYASTPTDYRVRLAVGPSAGQATTPANEQPNLASIGGVTYTYADSNDRAWIAFAAGSGNGLVGGSQFVVQSSTSPITIASGISLFKNSGFTTAGVGSFHSSAYVNTNRYYARRQSASVDGPHGKPFLEVYIRDGHGQPLNTKSVILDTQDKDGTSEDSQTLSTDANGRVRWNYQILDSHKAFNAFKSSPDDPDALGANDIAIPTADVHKPAGTKTGTFPDPKAPTVTRNFGAATFPGRSKKVVVSVNTTPAGERPTATANDVFGVHAELIFAGMWSGNTTDTSIDANGAPTGPTTRSKVTAAGSYAFKLSGLVDEANFMIFNAADHVPTDRAGRPYEYTGGFTFLGRRAVFNRTGSSVTDTGTSLDDNKQSLQTPLGYTNGTPAVQTFDTLAPPTDATTYGYYQGYASTTGQRVTFGLAAGATEVPRFTADSGLYGYKLQVVEYNIVRDDLRGELLVAPVDALPGETVRIKFRSWQVLPDKTRLGKAADDAPVLYIDEENGAGQPIAQIQTITMTPIGATPTANYEATFSPPAITAGGRRTFGVSGFAKIGGARVNLDTAHVTVGAIRDSKVRLVADVGLAGVGGGTHLVSGSAVEVNLFCVNNDTGTQLTIDTTPTPEFIVFRQTGTDLEYLDLSNNWQPFNGAADTHTLTLTGDVYTKNLGVLNNLETKDLIVIGIAYVNGIRYTDRVFREVVDKKNRHDRYQFTPLKNFQG